MSNWIMNSKDEKRPTIYECIAALKKFIQFNHKQNRDKKSNSFQNNKNTNDEINNIYKALYQIGEIVYVSVVWRTSGCVFTERM